MEFTCHTTYGQKALTAISRAVRRTVRVKTSRRMRLYAGGLIGILFVCIWITWGEIWQTTASCAAIVLLLLVNWQEDAINGYFAKRKALPGTSSADTVFYPDHYLVKTAAAETRWQYEKILALAETRDYYVLVVGKNHAMAIEKTTLEGGSISEFCRFLEEKSGHKIQNVGG